MLSLPNDWITHPRKLAETLGVGKDQMYSILNELIRLGYATKTNIQNHIGRFSSVTYEFHEEKIKINSTVSENPDTENPDPVNQTLHNRYDTKEIKKEKKTTKKSGGVFFDRETNQFKNLSEAHIAELKKTYPTRDIDSELDQMRLWLMGSDYKGTMSFITGWLNRPPKDSPKPVAPIAPIQEDMPPAMKKALLKRKQLKEQENDRRSNHPAMEVEEPAMS